MNIRVLILMVLVGCAVEGAFIHDETLKVVKDDGTCLVWQDDEQTKTLKMTWEMAVDYCESSEHATYGDWRLPNINELTSIGSQGGFHNVSATSKYWSSTTKADTSESAWYVYSHNIIESYASKGDSNYVRCVRNIE